MRNTLLLLFCFISITTLGQDINYEIVALEYYINKIETDSIFNQECDCTNNNYKVGTTLHVYNSSYQEIDPEIALKSLQLAWFDSLIWTSLDFEKVKIQNTSELKRIELTENPKDFNSNHYLIRFSERLKYKNLTFVEFNIKSDTNCSGINYYFLFNKTDVIEKYKIKIWCDSPG